MLSGSSSSIPQYNQFLSMSRVATNPAIPKSAASVPLSVSTPTPAPPASMDTSSTASPSMSEIIPLLTQIISMVMTLVNQSQQSTPFQVPTHADQTATQAAAMPAPSTQVSADAVSGGDSPDTPDSPDSPDGQPEIPETPEDDGSGVVPTPTPVPAPAPAVVTPTPTPAVNPNQAPTAKTTTPNTPSTTGTGAVSSTAPPNSVDVTKFGAVGDGKTDDGPAIQKAIDAAKASGQTIWLPPGTYNHSGDITLDGAKMTGAGDKSVLNATNPDQSAIKLTGNSPSLSNIKTTVNHAPSRSSMPDAAAVLVQGASNASVNNMYIQGASSNGIRLDGATGSNISNNMVTGTNADGIALMNGSTGNTIKGNVVNQAADDSFSDDSYTSDGKQDEGNTFDGNVSMANAYGRGIVLAGSKNDKVVNNTVSGSKWYGIYADSDPNSGTMASSGHTISNNTVINNPNGAPVQASSPGTNVSGTKTDGGIPDLKSILGWDPGALPDRYSFNPGYQPGTGSGANNSGGVRS